MNGMKMPSRHRIRNSSSGGLRPSTLPFMEALHNTESLRGDGVETFCFFETRIPERGTNSRSPTFQAGSFNHCTSKTSPVSLIRQVTGGRKCEIKVDEFTVNINP